MTIVYGNVRMFREEDEGRKTNVQQFTINLSTFILEFMSVLSV